jgi:predicted permease
VLAFTGAVSLAACVIAGLVPALQSARAALNPALKEVRAAGHGRVAKTLVVVQLAISMVLIVGATLFIGTLVNLYGVDRGFDSAGVLVVKVRTTQPYDEARGLVVQSALVDALRTTPGISAASATQVLALGGGLWTRRIEIDGKPAASGEGETVGFNVIAPGYFALVGTSLTAGREFDARDTASAPRVAIVNESFARYYFDDPRPIGRRVKSLNVAYEIVGVVRDAKYQTLRAPIMRTMYIPWLQREGDQPTRYSFLVRAASGDPLRLVPAVERVVRAVDPALRVSGALTYDTLIERSIVTERIMATLGGVFGALALVVAAVGLFGVLAFQVARRTNEIGVRIALGATSRRIGGIVLRDVAVMLVLGISAGGLVSLMLTGIARNLVFGLTPTDPRVFAVAAAILAVIAVFAAWLPARRAARVDPLVALRHE